VTATADQFRRFIGFYALGTDAMIAALPARRDGEFYQFSTPDSVLLINHPLEALLHITCEWHRRSDLAGVLAASAPPTAPAAPGSGLGLQDVDDLLVIIGMIIIVGQQCSYLYNLDKRAAPVTGPADGTWRILRKQALELQGRLAPHPADEPGQLFPALLAAVDAQVVRKRARRRMLTKRR
jgi:hypothetical protein